MVTRVLLVERGQSQRPSFADALKKRYEVVGASSGKGAIQQAQAQMPQAIILDAISMRTPGDRICEQIRAALPDIPLIHLYPGKKDEAISCADVLLVEPFTARKLVNAVERLVGVAVKPSADTLLCGPFALHTAQRILTFHGQEIALTPKMVQLVALFLQHPDVTLDRKTLMDRVWNTEYLGDTRTLDVHVRWIRRAVEADPSSPIYFKTVRGIGYRLEIPPEVEQPPVLEVVMA
jgi:DNA-binding response OmpR family regulator